MTLACIFCGAKPGERCRSKNGGMCWPRYLAGIIRRRKDRKKKETE